MGSPSDFQAIVFAGGRGNRMQSLTEHTPKALLPMANLPLFWFPLKLLHRNGVKDCLLVVLREQRAPIEAALNELPELRGMDIEIVAFDAEEIGAEEEEWGTADVLKRRLMGRLKKEHILLVSGDLVSDLELAELFRQHAERNATLTCVLTDAALGGPVPGPKERVKKYRDFVILSPADDRLLYLADEEDVADQERIPLALFARNPNVTASAKYKDVHLYAIQWNALNSLLAKPKNNNAFSSIKADLIPHLLMQRHSACFAWIPAKTTEFTLIAQCNNVGAYFEGNKVVQKLLPKLCLGWEHRKFEKGSGVNCTESWVAQSAEAKGKCQLKRSIIGDGCVLGEGAKVDNSVLIAGAVIGDGAVIKNSIVFGGAKIGEKADVNMCIVGPGQEVPSKGKFANTVIAEERAMELD